MKPIRVLFICHGNICRSPMAESLMTHMAKEKHIEDKFIIASAATSREEIGNPPHRGTVRKLGSLGVPLVPHRAVQMTKKDYEDYDYIIGMDTYNIHNMRRIAGGDPDGKMFLMLDFTDRPGDVADPWYTGNFEETYDDISEGLEGFFEYLKEKGELR